MYAKLIWLVLPIGFGVWLLLMRLPNDRQWTQDKVWVQRMKDEGCDNLFGDAEYLSHRHFLHTGIIAAAFGAIIGQFAEWQLFSNSGRLTISQWTWHETSAVTIGARSVITFTLLFVLGLLPGILRQFNF